MSMSDDPQELAGEILVLDQKGKNRTAIEDARLAGLLERFGDQEGSALSLVRAIGKSR